MSRSCPHGCTHLFGKTPKKCRRGDLHDPPIGADKNSKARPVAHQVVAVRSPCWPDHGVETFRSNSDSAGYNTTRHWIRTAFHIFARSLKDYLVVFARRRESKAARAEWRRAVRSIIKDLEALNLSTERDFLAVGEKLMGFRSTARRIAADMAALNELISGEQGRSASEVLARVLDHSKAIDSQTQESGQALGEVQELSRRVRLAFDGLKHRVSTLRTLCTLTRIETSRLGSTGADFGDLSAEVNPLSTIIESSGGGVMEASLQLDQGVRTSIRSASDFRLKQLKDLPALIDGVWTSLKAFEERRQRAVAASTSHAMQYGAVCQAIDDLVRSVQFHDITRQQIEHVMEALGQIESEHASRRGTLASLPESARVVLTLQSSQLDGASRAFGSSIQDMERDLENIAARAQEMAEASKELMGVSADEHDSFFLRMEAQFTAILELLGASATAQAGMESTAGVLCDAADKMSRSVAEIHGVELRIQRIATNATIQAAHLGAAGNALNVIAEVMHRLAIDSNSNTEEAADALHAMSQAAGRVSGGSEPGLSEAHCDTNDVAREMRKTVVELHSSSESSFSRVNQIAALGARLAADIAGVRSGFSAGRLFDQIVTRSRDELERIGALGGNELPESSGAATHLLTSHAKRYTMQMEREVHESVVRGSPTKAVVAAQAPKITTQEGDLGDNVELF